MPTWAWIVIAVAVVAVLVLAVAAASARSRARRREHLQDRFGPEYDRAVSDQGSTREAEAELERREEKRRRLQIVPLDADARDRYLGEWREIQSRFVDEPSAALGEADRLVTRVMQDRGYPMDKFEQRAADISVDHPHVVEHYRAAHAVYVANDGDEASTEDLRQGVVHYRALFEELLETEESTKEVAR